MKHLKTTAAVLFLLWGIFLAGAPEKELNSILASVNGSPVSLQDVLPLTRAREFRAFSTYTGEELKKQILKIRREAVDELIDRKLIVEDYNKQKFQLQERDIESALDEVADRMGIRSRSEFIRKLRQQGGSIEKMRNDVRDSMAVQLMLHRQYVAQKDLTPAAMYAYYRKNKALNRNAGSIELAMILLSGENLDKAEEIGKELQKDPAGFARLSRRWSSGPGKEDGGKLGKIDCRLLRPEFAKALTAPVKGKIYGPLKTAEGTVFLQVLDLTKPQERSFKESLPEIRKKLEAEQRTAAKKNYTQRLRKNAIIRYFF